MVQATKMLCKTCGRPFGLDQAWMGINYCRARLLVEVVRNAPGLSAWELSRLSGLPYGETNRGLTKGRDWGIFDLVQEDRTQGGFRYRYRLSERADEIIAGWQDPVLPPHWARP